MGRIEELSEHYAKHVSLPWERGVAGAQRVIMVVYDKEAERMLRARRQLFATATEAAGHGWHVVDLSDAFAAWIAADDFRDAYFESPEDLELKLQTEFVDVLAAKVREALTAAEVTDNSVVALFGVGSLFGFARVSQIVRAIERDVRGRLVIFFPGHFEQNNYRLLDARDGWNYLAVPITHAGNQHAQ
ncbi:hypothetical protein LBMAG47_14210 [Planctomycetia bacterium]|nr:hypothetical protein LBMAG47_14210 [Planctomycetia bacterium]